MILKDISFKSPKENILFDDVLLFLAEKGETGEVLRFWESHNPFIVLGKISKLMEDVNLKNARKDSIPILRRSSGGGTVIQGYGCLNFTLILSKDLNPKIIKLHQSYRFILDKVIRALNTVGVKSVFRPVSDIALIKSEKKISGNAQRRARQFIMHHGTILYDFQLSTIERYLKIPKKTPDYRKGRSHLDFLANAPASPNGIRKALSKAFGAKQKAHSLTNNERKTLEHFLRIKDVEVSKGKL